MRPADTNKPLDSVEDVLIKIKTLKKEIRIDIFIILIYLSIYATKHGDNQNNHDSHI